MTHVGRRDQECYTHGTNHFLEKVDVAKMKDIALRFCYAALKFCVRYELGNWAPVILGDLGSLVAWEDKN